MNSADVIPKGTVIVSVDLSSDAVAGAASARVSPCIAADPGADSSKFVFNTKATSGAATVSVCADGSEPSSSVGCQTFLLVGTH